MEVELSRGGAPWVHIDLPDRDEIAGEFYVWEVATALLGSVLEINPFDEPNVTESKRNTEALLASLEESGGLPAEEPKALSEGVEVFAPEPVCARLEAGPPPPAAPETGVDHFLPPAS